MANESEQTRPTVEEISVDRAIELLHLHREGDLRASPVVTVVRDPLNLKNIVSISVAEQSAFIGPGEL